MNVEDDIGSFEPSRRGLIKTGIAAAGAAYVAPQILNTAVAGAQTSTCYAFKIGGRGGDGGTLHPGPPVNDPSCGSGFNSPLGIAAGSSANLSYYAGAALVHVSAGLESEHEGPEAIIEVVGPNCTFAFVGYKAGPNCFPMSHHSIEMSGGGKVAKIKAQLADISHVTVVVCCIGSPV